MEELLAEKELMALVLGLSGFTYRDLPLLAAVSRKWRRLVSAPELERLLFAGGAFFFGTKSSRESPSESAKSLLPAGLRAAQVAINDAHSAVVSLEERQLFTWGSAQYGRLGYGPDQLAQDERESGHVSIPRPVAALAQHRVLKVALGPHHTVVLLADGQVHAFGTNECCQLGTGGERSMTNAVPKRLDALQREHVIDVSVGYSTNLALTVDGKVFSFGEGYGGGLGHGDEEDQPVPKLLEGLRGRFIVAIAAGFYDHNLALSGDGTVYSFGGCKYGELGHGEVRQADSTPRAIEALEGVRVVAIAAGDYHCLALSDAGQVYTWGLGKAGQLGHGDRTNLSAPKRVDALQGVRIEQIAAGENHSLALAEDGRLYGFGRAHMAQLGRPQKTLAVAEGGGVVGAGVGGGGEKNQQKEAQREQQAVTTGKHEAIEKGIMNKRYTLPVLVDAGLERLPVVRIAAFRQASIVYT